MEHRKISMLYIEDDKVDLLTFKRFYSSNNLNYELTFSQNIKESFELLSTNSYDIILSDFTLPDGDAFDIIQKFKDIPIIVVTGSGDEAIAVKALKMGAYDYLIKDTHGSYLQTLPITVENALIRKRNELDLKRYRENLEYLVLERTQELENEIQKRRKSEDDVKRLNLQLEQGVLDRTAQLQDALEEVRNEIAYRRDIEEELRAANRDKDKFFTIIAHDLKNPLHVLKLSSEILVSGNLPKLDSDVEMLHKQIYKSVNSLGDLLENLLQWARAQSGRIDFQPEEFDISELISKETELLSENARNKNITLFSKVPDKLYVYADKVMIATIIRNLISNAIKFTNNGGEVILTNDYNEDLVEISVIDNGIGISKEEIADLFDISVHQTKKGTNNESGTGLGLILCKEFIEWNSGAISVISTKNEGTEFKFTVPKSRKFEFASEKSKENKYTS